MRHILDVGDVVSFTIYENDFIGEIEEIRPSFRDQTHYYIRGKSTNHPTWEHPKPIITCMSHIPLTLVKKNER